MSAFHDWLGRLYALAEELGCPFDVQGTAETDDAPTIVFRCGCWFTVEAPGRMKAVTCRRSDCAVARELWGLARRHGGARGCEERTAAGETLERLRLRTELAQDEQGWWVEVLFWWNERAGGGDEPVRPEDDCLRVGPWPSRQVARREQRTGVRRQVVETVQRLVRHGGATFERFEVDDPELGAELEQRLGERPS